MLANSVCYLKAKLGDASESEWVSRGALFICFTCKPANGKYLRSWEDSLMMTDRCENQILDLAKSVARVPGQVIISRECTL